LAVVLATQGRPPPITSRFGFFVVNLLWLMTSLIGAIPLLASSLESAFTDAIFEAVAGVTTTGATVISGSTTCRPDCSCGARSCNGSAGWA
jgi:trk system potassium uptake protein